MASQAQSVVRKLPWLILLATAGCINLGSPSSNGSDGAPSGDSADANSTGTATVGLVPIATQPAPTGGAAPIVMPVGTGGGTTPSTPAANSNTPTTTTPVTPAPTNPSATEPQGLARYTLVGRMVATDKAIDMSFLGSKIGATFTGPSLAVQLSDTGTDGFNIVIDGKTTVLFSKPGTLNVTYPIADNLGAGPHTVWFTKRTEFSQNRRGVAVGQTTFLGFVLASGEKFMTPPASKSRRIEAIGDSSIAGYGIEPAFPPPGVNCDYSALTQNSDLTVPAVLARLLNAEYTNLSYTGEGISYSAYDGNPAHYLPVIWNQVVAPYASPAYNFAVPVDVVMISAGGNDLDGNAGSGRFNDEAKFINTYANWLVAIRGKYKNALILPILNPSASGTDRPNLINAIGKAIAQAQATLGGDANIVFYDYFANDPNRWQNYADAAQALGLGYGCGYHASAAGHEFLAGRLATFIKSRLGW